VKQKLVLTARARNDKSVVGSSCKGVVVLVVVLVLVGKRRVDIF